MTSNILITGGSGFVAESLILTLSSSGHKVTTLDTLPISAHLQSRIESHHINEMKNVASLASLIDENGFEIIFHLAANSDVKNGSVDSSPDFHNTMISSLCLAEALTSTSSPKVLIFSSTSAVYGNQTSPIRDVDRLFQPISNYGWAKLASERILFNAVRQKNIRFLNLRFPNVVGGNPTHGLLFDLRRKLLNDSRNIEILGNGQQTKPYLHVDDLALFMHKIVFNSDFQGSLNIGPGDTVTVREIVNTCVEITGLDPTISYGVTEFGWQGDVPNYAYQSHEFAKLSKEFGLHIRDSRTAVRDAFKEAWKSARI